MSRGENTIPFLLNNAGRKKPWEKDSPRNSSCWLTSPILGFWTLAVSAGIGPVQLPIYISWSGISNVELSCENQQKRPLVLWGLEPRIFPDHTHQGHREILRSMSHHSPTESETRGMVWEPEVSARFLRYPCWILKVSALVVTFTISWLKSWFCLPVTMWPRRALLVSWVLLSFFSMK